MLRCFFLCMLPFVLAAAPPPKTTSRLLRIPVWVQAEQPVALNPEDLKATLAGTTSRILEVKGPQDDLILILVLDLVDDLALGIEAKQALRAAIEKLPASTYVAVLRAQPAKRVKRPAASRRRPSQGREHLPASRADRGGAPARTSRRSVEAAQRRAPKERQEWQRGGRRRR